MSKDASIAWYDRHVADVAAAYEALDPDQLHGWMRDLLPEAPGLVLDVGAGSGRDAAWLAARGLDVVALEPSGQLREQGGRLHPLPRIRWIDDQLPDLAVASRLGLRFDLLWLSAIWQHVPPVQRPRAFRKLVAVLKPGGLLLVTLRHGPADPERAMHPVSVAEIEQLARAHGLAIVRTEARADQQGRPDVSWTAMALRLPDDGTGALPLLRHLILNDAKSATYKLGLLRVLCRLADGAAGLARDGEADHVSLPLGAVALFWLRLYLPLLRHDLPQSVSNRRGGEALGFVKAGTAALLAADDLPAPELRIGARFTGARAAALMAALAEAADTIVRMPATFMTFPNGGPVLPTARARPPKPSDAIVLDETLLRGFGTLMVPRAMWQALQRFSCWIEPSLVAEWIRLMKGYAARQDRQLPEASIGAAMTWLEPQRDVALPRGIALRLLAQNEPLRCVWSGQRLKPDAFDIDHCFPWAAWPCSDLWNLLPADRRINQHGKRDRLPSEALLAEAAAAIRDWWQAAYLVGDALPQRFMQEAAASLPSLGHSRIADIRPEQLLDAMQLHRLRLRHDQQVPEWRVVEPSSSRARHDEGGSGSKETKGTFQPSPAAASDRLC